MNAEIISVGTELLLGEIVDSNTTYLANQLRDLGINLYRTTTIGDNAKRIAAVILESSERADLVLLTGGLGPTIDDVTREAVALAGEVELEFKPELWEQIKERFARFGREPTDNNQRQAHIPKGAIAIENPVGTAPAFAATVNGSLVVCLPGVPAEMKTLFKNDVVPLLDQHFGLETIILKRLIRTAGMGESWIDAKISDLEMLENPTVGIAAHPGQVDIRVTARAPSTEEAETMLDDLEKEIRSRLGDHIYGIDEETLTGLLKTQLRGSGQTLVSQEFGTQGELADMVKELGNYASESRKQEEGRDPELDGLQQLMRTTSADVGVSLALTTAEDRLGLEFAVITPVAHIKKERQYGGPPELAAQWGAVAVLDLLRRQLSVSES